MLFFRGHNQGARCRTPYRTTESQQTLTLTRAGRGGAALIVGLSACRPGQVTGIRPGGFRRAEPSRTERTRQHAPLERVTTSGAPEAARHGEASKRGRSEEEENLLHADDPVSS